MDYTLDTWETRTVWTDRVEIGDITLDAENYLHLWDQYLVAGLYTPDGTEVDRYYQFFPQITMYGPFEENGQWSVYLRNDSGITINIHVQY